ncbi:hypothetical protein OH76DRAFT_1557909 [Lentinus brumalis]|uniref:F-box domain-containing protein n=1 Tax=Lentinus brumalis TaxID=2498619 RepID=A0A371D427_9APHY|nr:hypothetical protein OH76DRAFT_1557909 [Polyporus brumalis]
MEAHLNLDALLEVFCRTNMSTQSQIMKTCRVLYREGGKQLVRQNVVSLRTEAQLASFLLFMRADGLSRMPYIRALTVGSKGHKSSQAIEWLVELFAELVACASGLQKLSYHCVHKNPAMDGRLAAHIASMTTLTVLSVSRMDHPTWAILQHIRSRLTTAHFEFADEEFDDSVPPSDHVDLVHLLEGSRTTLESLTVHGSHFNVITTTTGPAYPRMAELDLNLETLWMPVASHYMQSFPNLRFLRIEDSGVSMDGRPAIGSPQCAALRASNRSYQQEYGSWRLLDLFAGQAQHLYPLGLTCRIEHLIIYDSDTSYEEVDATILRAMLSDARPTRLDLVCSFTVTTFMKEDWVAALIEARTPQIKHLTIKIDIILGDVDEEMERAIDVMYDIVASLSGLTAFHLDISRCFYRPGDPWDTYGHTMDVYAVANRFMEASPSMIAALVTLHYPPRPSVHARAGCSDACNRLFGFEADDAGPRSDDDGSESSEDESEHSDSEGDAEG